MKFMGLWQFFLIAKYLFRKSSRLKFKMVIKSTLAWMDGFVDKIYKIKLKLKSLFSIKMVRLYFD